MGSGLELLGLLDGTDEGVELGELCVQGGDFAAEDGACLRRLFLSSVTTLGVFSFTSGTEVLDPDVAAFPFYRNMRVGLVGLDSGGCSSTPPPGNVVLAALLDQLDPLEDIGDVIDPPLLDAE